MRIHRDQRSFWICLRLRLRRCRRRRRRCCCCCYYCRCHRCFVSRLFHFFFFVLLFHEHCLFNEMATSRRFIVVKLIVTCLLQHDDCNRFRFVASILRWSSLQRNHVDFISRVISIYIYIYSIERFTRAYRSRQMSLFCSALKK
jgi:hypothetical protein